MFNIFCVKINYNYHKVGHPYTISYEKKNNLLFFLSLNIRKKRKNNYIYKRVHK